MLLMDVCSISRYRVVNLPRPRPKPFRAGGVNDEGSPLLAMGCRGPADSRRSRFSQRVAWGVRLSSRHFPAGGQHRPFPPPRLRSRRGSGWRVADHRRSLSNRSQPPVLSIRVVRRPPLRIIRGLANPCGRSVQHWGSRHPSPILGCGRDSIRCRI